MRYFGLPPILFGYIASSVNTDPTAAATTTTTTKATYPGAPIQGSFKKKPQWGSSRAPLKICSMFIKKKRELRMHLARSSGASAADSIQRRMEEWPFWKALQFLVLTVSTGLRFSSVVPSSSKKQPDVVLLEDSESPQKSGSSYYNFKGYFSVVLLALVSSSGAFLMVDCGGKGLFRSSAMKTFLDAEFGSFPESAPLAGHGVVNHHILCDGGFAQTVHMQRPFTQIYRPMAGTPLHLKQQIVAAVILHNLLRSVGLDEAVSRFPPSAPTTNDGNFQFQSSVSEAKVQRMRLVNYFVERGNVIDR
ncbi:unnamed protein product [Heligmosomoides polygyrus]|uniref:DDE Tnp4 domain-containing protein n=1 Tax=Heligmosomoides polygyrus TaxID=6339 RepID=A0A3P8B4C5_HELPZ|nr:unnamed protein product [Heligmosomoides polygyrus]